MTDDPWHYVELHQYDRATDAYDSHLANAPACAHDLANQSIALVCQGRLPEALRCLIRGQKSIEATLPGSGGAYANLIGSIHWMEHRKTEAKGSFRYAIEGLKRRTIAYSDDAGGVSHGLLLWYVSRLDEDDESIKYAVDWLKNRAKRKAIENWPGPVARYVLGDISREQLLLQHFGTNRINDIMIAARSDTFMRRKLIVILFYIAAISLHDRDASRCSKLMVECACLENPHVEPEWYLARHYVGLDYWWKPRQQH